ncbi:cysteine proteinase inhibitor 3-like [Zingiber officinale]|nr:cysteine proteinase inhibitor 3-like [Zingiber officinale]
MVDSLLAVPFKLADVRSCLAGVAILSGELRRRSRAKRGVGEFEEGRQKRCVRNGKNALLEFTHVVKAREQVVAGTLHHLMVEAVVGGEKKPYEPKVWVKAWLNFKQVEEFKHIGEQGKSGVNS